MRRIIYVVTVIVLALCLVLLLVLAGVWTAADATFPTQTGNSGSGESIENTTDPSGQTSPLRDPRPMVSISLPKVTETLVAEDGTLLFYHTFQDVVLSTDNAEVNKAVTLDLLRRMDSQSGTISSLEGLTQYYTPGSEWITLGYEILYTPTRIDDKVLSLQATQVIASGSEFPEYSNSSVTYDLSTGQAMTLGQLLGEESDCSARLQQALLDVLAAKAEELALYDDYADVISRGFLSELQQESTWHLSKEGLCFTFAPYDIAPNSSGYITVTVPYAALSGVIRDNLLPGEEIAAEASPLLQSFASADLSGYTNFAECILDAEAEGILISADSVLYDVRLETGTTEDGIFVPDSTVTAISCMNAESALIVYTPLDDSTSTLLLHYRSNGQPFRAFLAIDASTGSPILVPAQE